MQARSRQHSREQAELLAIGTVIRGLVILTALHDQTKVLFAMRNHKLY